MMMMMMEGERENRLRVRGRFRRTSTAISIHKAVWVEAGKEGENHIKRRKRNKMKEGEKERGI